MSKTTLTIPLPNKVHQDFHRLAKENGTTARNLGALVIEQATQDLKSGKLKVDKPSLNTQ